MDGIVFRVAFNPVERLRFALHSIIALRTADLGFAAIEILKKRFPKEELGISPQKAGEQLRYMAYKGGRKSNEDQEDIIQRALEYWISAPTAGTKIRESWSFLLNHVKMRSITQSQADRKNRHRFRPEQEDDEEDQTQSGAPDLDNVVGIKDFLEDLDDEIVDLEGKLTKDEKALFDLIFRDGVGAFSPGVKDNMSQSTALKEKHPEMFERNKMRWSGFVGDLRKKLLKKIESFLLEDASPTLRQRLREEK